MLYVTGKNTTIVKAVEELVPDYVTRLNLNASAFYPVAIPSDCDRLVLAAGMLHQKTIKDQSESEIRESLAVNLISAMQICEAALYALPRVRICVIGSESGFSGSFDKTYAVAKAGLHSYVENRALKPHQQLVAVAPSIIVDSGMTARREDRNSLFRRAQDHPKKRLLAAVEVARLVHFLLYVDEGYITNTVIRMNGGQRP